MRKHTVALIADRVKRLKQRREVAAVQPRISELKADRRIVDTGLRRTNESGKKAAVFATPPKGTTPDQLNLFSQRH